VNQAGEQTLFFAIGNRETSQAKRPEAYLWRILEISVWSLKQFWYRLISVSKFLADFHSPFSYELSRRFFSYFAVLGISKETILKSERIWV